MGKQNNMVKFGVPGLFGCFGVPGCSGVFWSVPECFGVPVFRCSGVPVFRCFGVPGFSTFHTPNANMADHSVVARDES